MCVGSIPAVPVLFDYKICYMEVTIDSYWKNLLEEELDKDYFLKIRDFLYREKKRWKIIYPRWKDIFYAFDATPFDTLKVVILWQDPYHGPWQAHGLCFSVQKWVKIPPSLRNIFKEISDDIGWETPSHGCLDKRAHQGVLLLNAILTVEAHKASSHADIGWQKFTDAVIRKISEEKEWIVFLLRWAYAQSKKKLIDLDKHFVLETTHPSPFSAHKWFLWSRHFSQVNHILNSQNKREIDWIIT